MHPDRAEVHPYLKSRDQELSRGIRRQHNKYYLLYKEQNSQTLESSKRSHAFAVGPRNYFCRHSREGMSTVAISRLSRHCRRQSVDNSSTINYQWVNLAIIVRQYDQGTSTYISSWIELCGSTTVIFLIGSLGKSNVWVMRILLISRQIKCLYWIMSWITNLLYLLIHHQIDGISILCFFLKQLPYKATLSIFHWVPKLNTTRKRC